jgi:hypothetical protein
MRIERILLKFKFDLYPSHKEKYWEIFLWRESKKLNNVVYFRVTLATQQILSSPHCDIFSEILNHYQRRKNGVFWEVTPCGSCKNRSFGGT